MTLSTAPENIITNNGINLYKSGAEITVTVNDIPEDKYLQNISILTSNGYLNDFTINGFDTFTFTMPKSDVTLRVSFGILSTDLTLLKGTNDFIVTKGISSRDQLYWIGNQDETNGCTRLFDDDISTVWSVDNWNFEPNFERCCFVEFQTSEPVIPKHYVLITGDDSWQNKGQKPRNWDVYAKVKSSDEVWTRIAHVANDETIEDNNFASYTFDFDNPDNKAYRYFRFNVYDVYNKSSLQLSEMQMWVKNTAELADDADNSDEIDKWNNESTNVKLVGRTLYMDDKWNTLCLPFNIDDFAGTPLEGFTVKELDVETANYSHVTGFDNGTLYLNFKDAKSIKAGVPYIVKDDEVDARSLALTASNGSKGYSKIEGFASLVDGDIDTKWCSNTNQKDDGVWFCDFYAASPVNVTGYELTTGDDTGKFTDRNPKLWTLKGRLNGTGDWITLDSRDVNNNSGDVLPETNLTAKSYDLASDKQGQYQYFRFEVSQSGGNMQLSELKLQGTCTNATITNPKFMGVTVNNADPTPVTSTDGWVSFVGIYSPLGIGSNGDNTMLYLSVDNDGNSALFYPNGEMTINSCRAYFQLNKGLVGGEAAYGINSFVLNFGDETTSLSEELRVKSEEFDAGWYTIDGRKLHGKPTVKGIYINNGHKVVIK